MLFLSILHNYLLWHYTHAYYEMFHVWRNFMWFVVQFFSIPQLFKSLFSPWKRITEERTKKWDFEEFAGAIIINLISRLIGFIIRGMVIIVGLISLAITFLSGIVTYLLWIIAPMLIIALLIFGIVYIVI